MAGNGGVVGCFEDPAAAAGAIRDLRSAGFEVRAVMPAAFPEVIEAIGKPRSGIDFATLPGALVGLLLGLVLTIGTSLDWPLFTGGKPIVSLPPFVVVVFEVTVLIGSLTNLVAVAFGSFRGAGPKDFPRSARVPLGEVGVLARGGDAATAARILRERGGRGVDDVA